MHREKMQNEPEEEDNAPGQDAKWRTVIMAITPQLNVFTTSFLFYIAFPGLLDTQDCLSPTVINFRHYRVKWGLTEVQVLPTYERGQLYSQKPLLWQTHHSLLHLDHTENMCNCHKQLTAA